MVSIWQQALAILLPEETLVRHPARLPLRSRETQTKGSFTITLLSFLQVNEGFISKVSIHMLSPKKLSTPTTWKQGVTFWKWPPCSTVTMRPSCRWARRLRMSPRGILFWMRWHFFPRPTIRRQTEPSNCSIHKKSPNLHLSVMQIIRSLSCNCSHRSGLRADGHVWCRGSLRACVLGRVRSSSPETFIDYFAQISEFEPTRAAEFGIRHFAGLQ